MCSRRRETFSLASHKSYSERPGETMSKFRIKLKLTGLEIEVEGNRSDVPAITQNIGEQFAGLLMPATRIVEGEVPENGPTIQSQSIDITPVSGKKSRRRRPNAAAAATADKDGSAAVDWRHDTSKWGAPQQSWNSTKKAIWLLYVVSKETNVSELSAPGLASTFNKHFKQAGRLRANNLSRDLGKLKSEREAPVSEDTTKKPSTWFLTQAGIKRAEQLVAEAIGGPEKVAAAGVTS
jgi:hypothetical protein